MEQNCQMPQHICKSERIQQGETFHTHVPHGKGNLVVTDVQMYLPPLSVCVCVCVCVCTRAFKPSIYGPCICQLYPLKELCASLKADLCVSNFAIRNIVYGSFENGQNVAMFTGNALSLLLLSEYVTARMCECWRSGICV